MFKRCGNVFLAAALFLTTGTHWAVLQSLAWVNMMVCYSEKAPMTVALKETFDGHHPCPLCKAIAAAKKSEKKTEFACQTPKLEFPPAPENFALVAPARFEFLPAANDSFAESLPHKPLVPPPRGGMI